jgi:hypothetical protein
MEVPARPISEVRLSPGALEQSTPNQLPESSNVTPAVGGAKHQTPTAYPYLAKFRTLDAQLAVEILERRKADKAAHEAQRSVPQRLFEKTEWTDD